MTDLKLAFRSIRARPGFSLIVVLTLALGIGANTLIYSAVQGLLLRDPPFTAPEQLVRITTVCGDEAGGVVAIPAFDDLRALPVIADAAMYTDQGMYNASGFGRPEELQATITTHNLFRVLGVVPLVGGSFPAEFDRTRKFGLVISHGLWTRKFAQAPDSVGRTITLDGAPGYTSRLAGEFPDTNAGLTFQVTPLHELYTAAIQPCVVVLFGAVGLLIPWRAPASLSAEASRCSSRGPSRRCSTE